MNYSILCLVLLGVGMACSQMLDIADCGKKYSCQKMPTNCSPLATCSAVGIHFYNTTSNNFHFSIYFTKNWAAYGTSPNVDGNKMSGMRGFYCWKGAGELVGTAGMKSDSPGPPTLLETSNGVFATILLETDSGIQNGVNWCSFVRTMADNDYLHNLSRTDLVTTLAWGDNVDATAGTPQKHTETAVSPAAVTDWKQFTGMNTTTSTTTTTATPPTTTTTATPPTTTTIATTMAPLPVRDINDCGAKYNCQRMPSDCTSFATCATVGLYFFNPDTSMFEFEIYSNRKWAGYGTSPDGPGNQMVGMRGFYCWSTDGTTVQGGAMNSTGISSSPEIKSINQLDGVKVTTSSENGIYRCSFTRPMIMANEEYLHNLNRTDLVTVLGWGENLLSDNTRPRQHTIKPGVAPAPIANWMAFNGQAKGASAATKGSSIMVLFTLLSAILISLS